MVSEKDTNTSTFIRLKFESQDLQSIVQSDAWHRTLDAIEKEPAWHFTLEANDVEDNSNLTLIIHWKNGQPPSSLDPVSEEVAWLSFIKPIFVEKPQILNVAFTWPWIDDPYRERVIPPDVGYSPATVAELMTLQVPQELRSECNLLADIISSHVEVESSWRTADSLDQGILVRFLKGWVDQKPSSSGPQIFVLLWHWASLQEQQRFKDPKDTTDERSYQDWYFTNVHLRLERMAKKGLEVKSSFLEIKIATDPNGQHRINRLKPS